MTAGVGIFTTFRFYIPASTTTDIPSFLFFLVIQFLALFFSPSNPAIIAIVAIIAIIAIDITVIIVYSTLSAG